MSVLSLVHPYTMDNVNACTINTFKKYVLVDYELDTTTIIVSSR